MRILAIGYLAITICKGEANFLLVFIFEKKLVSFSILKIIEIITILIDLIKFILILFMVFLYILSVFDSLILWGYRWTLLRWTILWWWWWTFIRIWWWRRRRRSWGLAMGPTTGFFNFIMFTLFLFYFLIWLFRLNFRTNWGWWFLRGWRRFWFRLRILFILLLFFMVLWGGIFTRFLFIMSLILFVIINWFIIFAFNLFGI